MNNKEFFFRMSLEIKGLTNILSLYKGKDHYWVRTLAWSIKHYPKVVFTIIKELSLNEACSSIINIDWAAYSGLSHDDYLSLHDIVERKIYEFALQHCGANYEDTVLHLRRYEDEEQINCWVTTPDNEYSTRVVELPTSDSVFAYITDFVMTDGVRNMRNMRN